MIRSVLIALALLVPLAALASPGDKVKKESPNFVEFCETVTAVDPETGTTSQSLECVYLFCPAALGSEVDRSDCWAED